LGKRFVVGKKFVPGFVRVFTVKEKTIEEKAIEKQ